MWYMRKVSSVFLANNQISADTHVASKCWSYLLIMNQLLEIGVNLADQIMIVVNR